MKLCNRKHIRFYIIYVLIYVSIILCINPMGVNATSQFLYPYGVFLSIDSIQMDRLKDYEIVVIDAQYFTQEDIEELHEAGHTVYSYLNIGSIEDFREYSPRFSSLTLGTYENWEEEQWINTADRHWIQFILDELAPQLVAKGVDGFFVDNCDVFYFYHGNRIYQGVITILQGLRKMNLDVIINGGDCLVENYCGRKGNPTDIMTGINQETVFSSIDFDNDTFGQQEEEETQYFTTYIEKYGKMDGIDIYLLEYSNDLKICETIAEYCTQKGFYYYISDSLELD